LPLPQYLVEPANKNRQEKVAVGNHPFSALTFLTPNQQYTDRLFWILISAKAAGNMRADPLGT
jgi:hypothetical protein